MDFLVALSTFVRVTQTGSFSAAAHERGGTQSAVSRQITALEQELGVRLFHRTTRRLTLTEDGQSVLEHAREVLEAVEETKDVASRLRASPAGHVRLGLSVLAASVLSAHVAELLGRYPDLSLQLITGDSERDMIEEGLDLWLRLGESTQASQISRKIGMTYPTIVAAPAYLAANGEPQHPHDLAEHQCIVHHAYGNDEEWRFNGPEGAVSVTVSGRFSANNCDAVLRAALAGVGIAQLAGVLVRADIAEGRLCRLMPRYTAVGQPITLVYPSRRNLAPRVRAVIDFILEGLQLGDALYEGVFDSRQGRNVAPTPRALTA